MKCYLYLICIVLLAACGTSQKLKYGEQLFNKQSYAAAAEVFESIKGDAPEKHKYLGRTYFKMLHMEKAAEHFAKVPSESMEEEDKLIYCEVLKQLGNTGASSSLAATTHAAGKEIQINDYQHPLVKSPEAEIKVYPEEFNTKDDDMTPFFYVGSTYFMTNFSEKYSSKSKFGWNGKPFMQIVDTAKSVSNSFSKINTALHEGPVFLDENLGVMWFNRSIAKKGKNPARIAILEKKTTTLKDGKATEVSFSDKKSNYLHPFVSDKGNKLLFASNKPDGLGGYDLYIAARNDDGSYGEVASVGALVNSAFDEVYPTLITDSALVFASNRTSGYGGLDLYVSNLDKDGNWSSPRLLDMPLNSTRDDFHMIASPDTDGKYFFTTNREGNDDIYSAFIPQTLGGGWEITLKDAESTQVIRGLDVKVTYDVNAVPSEQLKTNDSGSFQAQAKGSALTVSSDGYKQAQLTYHPSKHAYFSVTRQTLDLVKSSNIDLNGKVIDNETKEGLEGVEVKIMAGTYKDSVMTGGDGGFSHPFDVVRIQESNSFEVVLEKSGYAPKRISGLRYDQMGAPFSLNAIAGLELKKIGVGDDLAALLSLKPIYFETAKWNITAQGAEELDKVADILLNNPQFVIECGSHTDCRGNRAANETLSSKRAESTAKYLISKGVTANQLKYKGYGEDMPINDCRCEGATPTTCTEEELALNRRTEFKVVKENEVDIPVATNGNANAVEEVVVSNTPITINPDKVQSTATIPAIEPTEMKLLDPIASDNFVVGSNKKYENTSDLLVNTMPAGKLYMVQIGAFREEIDVEMFNGMEPVYSERTKAGFTRYCVGMFTTYEKAEQAMKVMHRRGFTDAFVVGYREGNRVPVQSLYKVD